MAARFQNNGRRGRVVASDASLLSSGAIGRRPITTHGHGSAASGREASVTSGADARGAADSLDDEDVRGAVSAGIASPHEGGQGKLVAHRREDAGRGRAEAGLDAADAQDSAAGDGLYAEPAPKTPRLGFARPIRLAVIGAGKVGCSMARYLSGGPSVEVVGFYSRNPLASEEAANFAGGRIFATAADAVRAAEVILVTTPDGAIADVWNQLKAEAVVGEGVRDAEAAALPGDAPADDEAAYADDDADAAGSANAASSAAAAYLAQKPVSAGQPLRLAGKIFVHCSGACPSSVFEGAAGLGAQAVSMHPIYAVSSRFDCWRELEQAWFSLEGDAEGASVLEALLRARGNHVMRIRPQDKSRYHLAAVMASNLVVGLYNMAAGELAQCGVSREDAEAALAPLFLGNASHIAEDGVEAAITGPAARGDWDTLNAHLACLDGDPRRLAAYRALTDELIALTHPEEAPGGVSTPAWDVDEA